MIEEWNIKTIDDVDVKGKTVFVRVDINSPVDPETKKILDDTRIRVHALTIGELADKGAKVVVLAHQGRPGEPDFISLEQHAKILSNILKKEVKFVKDIFGEEAKKAIRELKPGEILVLENVRMWPGERKKKSPEEHAQSELVKNLAPLCDIFVVDAFAAAHRMHASLVGFAPVVPEYIAGRVMERELKALTKVLKPEKPCIYVLGGAKAEDSADVADAVLSKNIADKVLTGGLVANLFLYSKGYDLGKPNVEILEKKGFLELKDRIKKLLDKYSDKIVLPVDLGVEVEKGKRKEVKVNELPTDYLIKDIGKETMEIYAEEIKKAKTIVFNGPMGVFEEKPFDEGTRKVFEAISQAKAFSLVGGGHTVAAMRELGFEGKVSYASTGGGALIEFLIKGTLPVIEVLRKYSKK